MAANALRTRTQGPWRILLALVCVLLVAAAGIAQIAHIHADGTDNHADCSLCAAAHITVHPTQTPVSVPAAAVVTALEACPPFVQPCSLSTFALFTRPPPVAAFPA